MRWQLALLVLFCSFQVFGGAVEGQAAPKTRQAKRIFEEAQLEQALIRAVDRKNLKEARRLLARGASANTNRDNLFEMDKSVLDHAIESGSAPMVKLLTKHGANVNLHGQFSEAPLLRAIGKGDVAIVKVLLAAGAKFGPGTTSPYPMLAAGSHSLEVVKLLMVKGVSINQQNFTGKTVLMEASGIGHPQFVKELLRLGAKVNVKSKRGRTALHVAVSDSDLETARLLVQAGADVNCADKGEGPPLIYAIQNGENTDLVELLLNSGANPNPAGKSGSPLTWAAGYGYLESVKALLAHGAKVTDSRNGPLMAVLKGGNTHFLSVFTHRSMNPLPPTNDQKFTAAQEEATRRDTAIVQLLLEHGLDVSKDPNRGALAVAAKGGVAAIVRLLLAKGAPVDSKDTDTDWTDTEYVGLNAHRGDTALMASAGIGNFEIVRMLLAAGADPNLTGPQGQTALLNVTSEGRALHLQLLPRAGDRILYYFPKGERRLAIHNITALDCAGWRKWADYGDVAIVNALLNAKADPRACDKQGRTPRMAAAGNSSPAVVQLLLKAATAVNAQDTSGRNALMSVVAYGRDARSPYALSAESKAAFKRDISNPRSPYNAQAKAEMNSLTKKAALFHAEALAEDVVVVKALLAAGADLKAENKEGCTVLQMARRVGHKEIIGLLERGAAGAVRN